MSIPVLILHIAAVLAGLAFFFGIALWLVPVRVTARFASGIGSQELSAAASWGPVGIRRSTRDNRSVTEVLVFSYAIPVSFEEPGAGVPGPSGEKATGRIRTAPDLIPLIRNLSSPAFRILSALFHEGRFERCEGRVRIGLGDPASTGMLYGSYWATRFLFAASRIFIRMEPVFDRTVLELDLTARYSFSHPLRILMQVVCEFFRPDVRAGIAALRKGMKEPL